MSAPGPEARIAAQEQRIEELAQNMANDFKNMTTRFKANADYLIEVERQLEARLDKIEATQDEHGDLLRQILQAIQAKPSEG